MISFWVHAVPVAQPRQRATLAHGGKGARMHEVTHIKNAVTGVRKPHPIAAFKAAVGLAASNAYSGAPLQGPLIVRMLLLFPRPGRLIWKTRAMPRIPHDIKPDVDNCIKAIFDALKSKTWIDDAQVFDLTVKKRYASGDEQAKCWIEIEQLGVS